MSKAFSPSPLFERVERARRRKHKFTETHITLAHGSGGRAMHELIEGLFLDYFRNPLLEKLEDQAVFDVPISRLAYTTDSYVVSPIFFRGGDIGKLAIGSGRFWHLGGIARQVGQHAHDEGQLDLPLRVIGVFVGNLHSRWAIALNEFLAGIRAHSRLPTIR